MPNRIWIELERPETVGDHATGHARAALASAMLQRLGADPKQVWWHEKHHRYCFVIDGAGSYTEAEDNGRWFNLDFFGRDVA